MVVKALPSSNLHARLCSVRLRRQTPIARARGHAMCMAGGPPASLLAGQTRRAAFAGTLGKRKRPTEQTQKPTSVILLRWHNVSVLATNFHACPPCCRRHGQPPTRTYQRPAVLALWSAPRPPALTPPLCQRRRHSAPAGTSPVTRNMQRRPNQLAPHHLLRSLPKIMVTVQSKATARRLGMEPRRVR